MDVILVVDMQVGLLEGAPKHDLRGVIDRINRLTAMVRGRSGRVVWIRHCGKPGDGFAPNTAGWAFLPELMRQREDMVIEKTLNDPLPERCLRRRWSGSRRIACSLRVGPRTSVWTRRCGQPFQTGMMSLPLPMVTR